MSKLATQPRLGSMKPTAWNSAGADGHRPPARASVDGLEHDAFGGGSLRRDLSDAVGHELYLPAALTRSRADVARLPGLSGRRIVLYHFVSDTFEVLDGRDARRLGWVCPYFCNAKHDPVEAPFAVSPDGESVAISHRRGTAVWDVATDSLKFALHDPQCAPLHP